MIESLRSRREVVVAATERDAIEEALEATNWHRGEAAKLLEISYRSLLGKMEKYGIGRAKEETV
jgi:DNA-binding NtrC family response regulator